MNTVILEKVFWLLPSPLRRGGERNSVKPRLSGGQGLKTNLYTKILETVFHRIASALLSQWMSEWVEELFYVYRLETTKKIQNNSQTRESKNWGEEKLWSRERIFSYHFRFQTRQVGYSSLRQTYLKILKLSNKINESVSYVML